MSRYILGAALAFASAAFANAECGRNEPLCGDSPKDISVKNCQQRTYEFSMDPCCSRQSVADNSCPENPVPTCRSIGFDKAILEAGTTCCNTTASFEIVEVSTPSQCCDKCACWGDPHCFSFNGTFDTWVLCDGRVIDKSAKPGENPCPVDMKTCRQQLDYEGNKCGYSTKNYDSIATSGSPCRSKSKKDTTMNMYSIGNDFSVTLVLGERAIITAVSIMQKTAQNVMETYYLDAKTCIKQDTPWRTGPDDKDPPLNPTWLPYSWARNKIQDGFEYPMTGFKLEMKLSVRCIQVESLDRFGNKQLGVPRLSVDIEEPEKKRQSTDGFCVDSKIDTGKATTQHTKDIYEYCRSFFSDEKASDYFCPKLPVQEALKCRGKWCKEVNPANEGECVDMLKVYGWEKTWCAYNTLPSKNPAECTSGSCLKCTYDVYDFGWADAVKVWAAVPATVPQKDCLKLKDLLPDLPPGISGTCLQYFDDEIPDGDVEPIGWTNYGCFPQGSVPCKGELTFNSLDSASENIFYKKLRLHQCNNDALAPFPQLDPCAAEKGFQLKVTVTPGYDNIVLKSYSQLIRENKIVCNPKYNPAYEKDKLGCLKKFMETKTYCDPCKGCE